MQHSIPGKKLNPIISAATTPIFERNPERYRDICRWVWHCQRGGWPDEAIIEALNLGDRTGGIDQADNWWAYLTKLLHKGKAPKIELTTPLI